MNIFNRNGITLKDIGKSLWGNSYRTTHEFRNIIALHEIPMVIRIGTRQFERLRATTILIYVGKEGTRVSSVVTAAAEDHPPSVR